MVLIGVIFVNRRNAASSVRSSSPSAIAASRFSRYPVVTASLDRIDFKHPIPAGSIVEMVARVTRLGRTSVQVTVDVYVEYLRTSDRLHAVTGQFVMVAIGENKKPVVIDV